MCSIVCFILLLFFVLDAVLLSTRMLRSISAGPTQWPRSVLQSYALQYRVDESDLAGFLDVKFAAENTRELGKLVLVPFIIQFLFILSRSAYFDNWTWTGTLIGIFVCNTLLAGIGWMILRRAARKIRRDAEEEVGNALKEVEHQMARDEDNANVSSSALRTVRHAPVLVPASMLTDGSLSQLELGPASVSTAFSDSSDAARQLESLLQHPRANTFKPRERKLGLETVAKEITGETRGAYAPFFQDPALLAMLIPTGLLGLLSVLFRAFFGRI
jgi:hypothetical protein